MSTAHIGRYATGRRISPRLAMRLISRKGTRTEVVVSGVDVGGASFYDGDILMRFVLANGGNVLYRAIQESDYYGGHYDEISWEYVHPVAPT